RGSSPLVRPSHDGTAERDRRASLPIGGAMAVYSGDAVTGTLRRIFLWMASNRWLRYHLPRLGFARRAVLRFMPGEDSESALRAGKDFQKDGIAVVFTRLGEKIKRLEEDVEGAEHYIGISG